MSDHDGWPKWLLIGGLIVLFLVWQPKPERPLPWESNDRHTIKILNRDYEVSRFWGCGWGGTCPMKTWTYEVRITPKDPIQALLWLQRSRTKHDAPSRSVLEPLLLDSHTPEQVREALLRALKLEQERVKDLHVSRDPVTTLESSIARLDRISSGDRAAAEEIMNETSEGLLFHATYRIDRAGKSNERVLDWWLLPGGAP